MNRRRGRKDVIRGRSKLRGRIAVFAVVFVFLGTSACLATGPFTGRWETEIGISPQQTIPFTSFTSTLDVGFRIGFLEIWSSSDFILTGWLWQELGLCASLGFLSFDGGMLFEPRGGEFLYAQGRLEFDFHPLVFRIYSAITGPRTIHGLTYGHVINLYGELLGGFASFESSIFLSADLSGITFTHTAAPASPHLLVRTYMVDPTIGPTPVGFSGAEFTFRSSLFAAGELTSTTTFTEAGFESQEVELTFINLLGLPFNLTLDYTFSLQTASHTFTPSLVTEYGCLRIYTGILGTGGEITGIAIYGVAFQGSFAGTTFTSISNLDTTAYVITTPALGSSVMLKDTALAAGYLFHPQHYWQIVSLEVETPSALGSFTFSVSTFFSTTTGLLFDWGKSEMAVTAAIGRNFSATSAVTVDTTGFSAWKISTSISW